MHIKVDEQAENWFSFKASWKWGTINGYQLFKKCHLFKNTNCWKSTNYSRSVTYSRNTNNAKSTNYSKMIFGKFKTVQVVYIKRNSKMDKSACFHFNKPSGIDKVSSKSLNFIQFFSNKLPNESIDDFIWSAGLFQGEIFLSVSKHE